MKAYKGFNKDMTCRGFQYEEGKTYELPEGEEAKLCESGFHACENPLDCFGYYAPGQSVFHEVELDATEETQKYDSNRVGKRIKIGAELSVANICKAHFEYVKERCNPVNGRLAGDNEAVSVGDKASASAGNCGSASAGNYGSASAGESGSASAGESGSASAGNYGSASAGESGSASAGNYGSAVSRGKSSVAKNGIACARGNNCWVRGGLGAVLVIGEEKGDSYELEAWKAVVVDGKNIKPDTWYTLKDGEFVEVKEQ